VTIPTSSKVEINEAAECRSITTVGKAEVKQTANLSVGNSEKPASSVAVKLSTESTWTRTGGTVKLVSTYTTEALKLYFGEVSGFKKAPLEMKHGSRYVLEEAWEYASEVEAAKVLGELETNGKAVTAKDGRIEFGEESNVRFGKSVIKGVSTVAVSPITLTAGATLSASEATLELETSGENECSIARFHGTWKKIVLTGTNNKAKLEINSSGGGASWSVGTIEMNTAGAKETVITMSAGQKMTVTESWTTNSKAGSVLVLKGSTWTVVNSTGASISLDYLELSRSTAEGANHCYYGTHSTIGAEVVGWLEKEEGVTTLKGIAKISFFAKGEAKAATTLEGKSRVTFADTAKMSVAAKLEGKTQITFTVPALAYHEKALLEGKSQIRFAATSTVRSPTVTLEGTSKLRFATQESLSAKVPLEGSSRIRFATSGASTAAIGLAGKTQIRFFARGSVTEEGKKPSRRIVLYIFED